MVDERKEAKLECVAGVSSALANVHGAVHPLGQLRHVVVDGRRRHASAPCPSGRRSLVVPSQSSAGLVKVRLAVDAVLILIPVVASASRRKPHFDRLTFVCASSRVARAATTRRLN